MFVKFASILALPALASAGTLVGPVVDDGAVAVLEDFLQIPFSSGSPPHARVNGLREAPDGSGRLFIADLNGPFYVYDAPALHLYLDFAAAFPALKTSPGLASGFVSFALHPDFAANGLFYTVHSETGGASGTNLGPALPTTIIQHSILTEWTATDPAANVFAGTSRELLRIASHHDHHNLGEIAFDPAAGPGDDGYGLLYIAAGDFGSVELGQADQLQRLDTPYGALLRIDPLGGPFERDGTTYDYGIPASNPYANDADPATLGEVYAHGLRNGHRIVWDTSNSGAAFVTDIGEANVEEVNVLSAGANYGWPEREGTFRIDVAVDPGTVLPLPPDDASYGYRYPAAQYDHEDTGEIWSAIAGGVVVRGHPGAVLNGRLVFGDIVNGVLFHASVDELLAADDADPATTAPIHALGVWSEGEHTTLLERVNAALGNPANWRVDLRLSSDRSGGVYLTTKRDAMIRRLRLPEEALPYERRFAGLAVGGHTIAFSVAGVALQIVTSAGQGPAEIGEAMAAAIHAETSLQAAGVHGLATSDGLRSNAEVTALAIGDPGIGAVALPTLGDWGSIALLLALLGAGMLQIARQRRRPRS